MRVLVCGGRDYTDEGRVYEVLDRLRETRGIEVVMSGCASGVDAIAHAWGPDRGVRHLLFVADWRTHGKAAGPIRNQRMLDEGKPDLVVAFPGGKGTADMVRRARKAGVEVEEVKA